MSFESAEVSWGGWREQAKALGSNLTSCPQLLAGYGKIRLELSLGRARESSVTLGSLKRGLVCLRI